MTPCACCGGLAPSTTTGRCERCWQVRLTYGVRLACCNAIESLCTCGLRTLQHAQACHEATATERIM